MSFIVPPVDGRSPAGGGDLGVLRFARRRPALPPDVVEQLEVAAQLYEDLLDAGVTLRFDEPAAGGRLRAVLVDEDGHEIREVPLTDVVALRVDAA